MCKRSVALVRQKTVYLADIEDRSAIIVHAMKCSAPSRKKPNNEYTKSKFTYRDRDRPLGCCDTFCPPFRGPPPIWRRLMTRPFCMPLRLPFNCLRAPAPAPCAGLRRAIRRVLLLAPAPPPRRRTPTILGCELARARCRICELARMRGRCCRCWRFAVELVRRRSKLLLPLFWLPMELRRCRDLERDRSNCGGGRWPRTPKRSAKLVVCWARDRDRDRPRRRPFCTKSVLILYCGRGRNDSLVTDCATRFAIVLHIRREEAIFFCFVCFVLVASHQWNHIAKYFRKYFVY